MRPLQDFLYAAAGSMNLWRDAAIVLLALVVIGCLWLASAMYGE